MKKILYSLMAIGGLFATSCATFDDPVTENYGEGPKVTITVTETTDSTFTFQVNAEGALYYSVLVDQSTKVASLDATSLYKGSYSSTFAKAAISAKDNATYTYNMRDAEGAPLCLPNTTYQIYAVAGSEKGVIGEIAVAEVTTTDANAPKPTQYQYDPDSKVMYVLFNENIARGEGAVTAKVYKYMDLMTGTVNPEAVPAEEIVVKTSGKQIAIAVPTTYAGAYVTFSWEAGAFVDSYGNACGALTSGFSTAASDFVGLYGRNTKEAFAVTEANVTEPALGSSFLDWTEFFGTVTLDYDVYANTDEAGAVTVTYSNAVTEKTIKLTTDSWAVEGNQFMFILPESPADGDYVSVKVAEGTFVDAYGNPNAEFEFANAWQKLGFQATEDMVCRTFTGAGISSYDGLSYDLGTITITAVPEYDSEVPAGHACVIENFYIDGSEVLGYYDLSSNTVYMGAYYSLGSVFTSGGTEYGTITYSLTGADWIKFTINSDGTLTSEDLGIVACDTAYTTVAGWWDKFSLTTFTPAEVETQSTASTSAVRAVKSLKSAKSLKQIKK